MKLTRKFLSMALAVLMIMSVLIIPAAAASTLWQDEFATFRELYEGSTAAGYIRMLQRFLYGYNNQARSEIILDGGVTGIFDVHTTEAVKIFQNNVGLDDDGRPGKQTWRKIASVLIDDGVSYLHVKSLSTNLKMAVVYYKLVGSATSLYTFNQDGAQFPTAFHSAKFT